MRRLRRSNRVWLVVCILGLGAAAAAALPTVPFGDTFNDNTRGSLWDEDVAAPNKVWLDEVNQRLEFRSTAQAYVHWAWYVASDWYLDTAHDFALKVDWHFSHVGGRESWVQFRVGRSRKTCIGIEAGYERVAWPYVAVYGDTKGVSDVEDDTRRSVDDGTFYISYDSAKDKLYLSTNGYWVNEHKPANGNWVYQGKVRGQWNAAALQVGLGGESIGVKVTSGEAHFDNFKVQQGTVTRGEPSAPTNVKASDGTYEHKVRVTWGAVTGATKYRVFRANKADGTKSAVSDWTGHTKYGDTTAKPGKTYFYWVKAKNAQGKGDFSDRDSGFMALAVPSNVQASDDTYADRVQVTWDAVTGAQEYRVFRAGRSDGTKKAISDWIGRIKFSDTTGSAGKAYYYWVKARNRWRKSDYSAYDTGSRTG